MNLAQELVDGQSSLSGPLTNQPLSRRQIIRVALLFSSGHVEAQTTFANKYVRDPTDCEIGSVTISICLSIGRKEGRKEGRKCPILNSNSRYLFFQRRPPMPGLVPFL